MFHSESSRFACFDLLVNYLKSLQGEDGKKLKSRSGDTIRLKDLLNEAIKITEEEMVLRKLPELTSGDEAARAAALSSTNLSDEEIQTARTIGIAAVKYADLSMNRESSYRFSYKKMLSLSGNTAPYMLYAYVRIRGIQRKATESLGDLSSTDHSKVVQNAEEFVLRAREELQLAKHLILWDEVLLEVSRELYPNKVSLSMPSQFLVNGMN